MPIKLKMGLKTNTKVFQLIQKNTAIYCVKQQSLPKTLAFISISVHLATAAPATTTEQPAL